MQRKVYAHTNTYAYHYSNEQLLDDFRDHLSRVGLESVGEVFIEGQTNMFSTILTVTFRTYVRPKENVNVEGNQDVQWHSLRAA